ncbi:hypothetical protein K1719_009061 [Acacia pycnantha]|nr:hypothetical protein K1719_009061 [Acacia pycnantha]
MRKSTDVVNRHVRNAELFCSSLVLELLNKSIKRPKDWGDERKVERLKSMCLQYSAATQWLISSSIKIHSPEEAIDGSTGLGKVP